MKAVLLIKRIELVVGHATPASDADSVAFFLMLSQEQDLDPGMILRLGSIMMGAGDTTLENTAVDVQKVTDQWAGSLWAPRFIGVSSARIIGSMTDWSYNVWVHYERVLVPFWDWFMMWELLDNVTDRQEEF